MARKQKRRGAVTKARARTAQPAPPSAAQGPSAAVARGGRVGGDQALVRSVEMSLGGQTVLARGRGRNRIVLDSGNPGIPLDRVPYFTTDLRRIAIIGGLMVVLLIVAAYTVIPLVTR